MAVRYVEIGQYPDVRREVRGKLSEILVAAANPGTYAAPEDVTGCFLEMGTDGKWDGASVGSFGSLAQLNALPTAYLATGARASVLGVQYTYGAGGWTVAGGGGGESLWHPPYSAYASNLFRPADQIPANIIDNYFVSDLGVNTSFAATYISSVYPVTPGQVIAAIVGATVAISPIGGYYLDGTWVSKITLSGQNGQFIVPAGVNQIRINVEKSYTGELGIWLLNSSVGSESSTISSVSCIGDSIALGHGSDADNIWWKLACEKLGCTTFQNLGSGGSSIAYPGSNPISRRLSAITKSDYHILSGGANDYSYSIPLGSISDTTDSTFYGALNVIAKYMREKFPTSRIIYATSTLKGLTANTASATADDYSEAIRRVAKLNGFGLIDFNLWAPNLSIHPYGKMFSTDGLHPGIALSRMMSDYAYKCLVP